MAGGVGHGLAVVSKDAGEAVLLDWQIDSDGGSLQLLAVLLEGG